MEISSKQLRAARAMLGWSQQDLADKAIVSVEAIKKYELGTTRPRQKTIEAIRVTFEKAGLEFTPTGVQERDNLVIVYKDKPGYAQFFDDVYETAKTTDEEFLVLGVDEKKFLEAHEKAGLGSRHRERMRALNKVAYRIILSQSDPNVYGAEYARYRRVPDDAVSLDVPFYIYGDKLAIILWTENPQIIVVNDPLLTKAYKQQFEFIWRLGYDI